MSFLLTAIVFILIFSVLVLIHEFGHYFVAKKSGIKVEEFGFGLPPRIWGVRKGETIYSINAIPFGGFVRLLGEDGRDQKVNKNPRSFVSKPARVRILVILAGVIMNFLLAWLLLTIGFTFGIQPLILSSDDVLNSIQDGTIQTTQGIVVQEIQPGGAAEKAGLLPGDRIVLVNGKEVFSLDYLLNLINTAKNMTVVLEVDRGVSGTGESGGTGSGTGDLWPGQHLFLHLQSGESGGLGFKPYQLIFLSRLVVQSFDKNFTQDSHGGPGVPDEGDIILKMNDQEIYSYDEYVSALNSSKKVIFTIWRNGMVVNSTVDLPATQRVIVSNVFPGTPAEKADFRTGDVVVSADGQLISLPDDVLAVTKQKPGQTVTYVVERDGQQHTLQVQPDKNGLIGVGLSVLYPRENQLMTVYGKDEPASVLKIQDVRYPVWIAPLKALDESWRLAGLTVQMFGNVLKSFFTQFTIPQGVAGPVGIAQMTYTFVQEGVLSLLRFMALLSLSLAIINVLPIPALDGGRLFFILIEIVTGKKVNGKWEAVIHGIGFLLLMILILAVTYSDIIKLF